MTFQMSIAHFWSMKALQSFGTYATARTVSNRIEPNTRYMEEHSGGGEVALPTKTAPTETISNNL